MYFYFFASVRKWNKCINNGDLPPSVWNGQHLQIAVKYAWQSIISNSIKSVTSPDNSNLFAVEFGMTYIIEPNWFQTAWASISCLKQLKLIDVWQEIARLFCARNPRIALSLWENVNLRLHFCLSFTFYTSFAGSLVLTDKKWLNEIFSIVLKFDRHYASQI